MTRNLLMAGASIAFAADSITATNGAAAAAPAKADVKTVADDMDSRRIFGSVEEAVAYLSKCAEELSDFGDTPFAAVGVDSEGNFDPEVYTADMDVMVSTLRKAKGGIKAVVVAPVPNFESILASPEAKAWAQKILHKELNHVAVRPLREAADVSTVVDQMPKTLGAYISSQREASGMIETYNELYKQLNATLAQKIPVWAKARLTKSELKKALESKAYAEEYYPALENRGEGKDSLLVTALQLGIAGAKKKGLDPQIFQRWLDTRDQKALTVDEDEEFDMASLTDSMLTEEKPASAADATASA